MLRLGGRRLRDGDVAWRGPRRHGDDVSHLDWRRHCPAGRVRDVAVTGGAVTVTATAVAPG